MSCALEPSNYQDLLLLEEADDTCFGAVQFDLLYCKNYRGPAILHDETIGHAAS